MDSDNRALPLRIISGAWRGLDRLRRLLHLIFLLGIFLFLLAAAVGERVFIPQSAALLIAPRGTLVDQLSGNALDRALARAQGAALRETLVRDIVDALRAARDDDRIKAVVLDLDELTGAGLSKLQAVAAEIRDFKQSGKPVIAVGDSFTRDQYYLAAQADDVYMNPMGQVLVDGYARFLPYYKSLLEKFYVDYNVWTVGEFKSFVEPITRDDMSPQDEEASRAFLNQLWGAYQADVTTARGMPAPALQQYADDIVTLLSEARGDTARLAKDYGLVDDLLTRGAYQAVPVKTEDVAWLGYTSGTTGQPKGAILTHRGATHVAAVVAERFGYREDDVVLCALPLFHSYAVNSCMIQVMMAGASAYEVLPSWRCRSRRPARISAACATSRKTHRNIAIP